jgi:hypothetical protein
MLTHNQSLTLSYLIKAFIYKNSYFKRIFTIYFLYFYVSADSVKLRVCNDS